MKSVIINDKKHQFPTSYEEMTFKMWCDFVGARQENDHNEIIAILTGIPIEEVKGSKIQGLEILLRSIEFLKKEPQLDEQPEKLGKFVFPKKIEFESVEQYQDTLAEIKRIQELNDLKEANKALAYYAAIYCQEPYDSDRAKALAESFMSYPCLEVLSAGSFFMAKSQSIATGYSMSFLRQNILLRKNRPVLRRLVRRLGFILHLTPSRGM